MSSDNTTELPQLGDVSLERVIAAMTLQEKVRLVRGIGQQLIDPDADSDGPVVGNTEESRVPGAAGETNAIERLGIPAIVMADGPAGVRINPYRDNAPGRSFHATAFPVATLLASSWDEQLVERVGAAMGHEAKEYGVDVLLAPGVNIQRYPLGGRNFEYYSEDSLLSGSIAAAFIRGVQGEGVGTSIKHYVANNHEWNRDTIDVQVDIDVLREIYLRNFEIAIKASQPWTVMSSYNKVNGEYASESPWLLTEVLREQWGFDGVVVTDWFGGRNPALQMQAGNDLLMPGLDDQEQALIAAVQGGALDEAVIDTNVERILKLILKTPTFNQYPCSEQPDLSANAVVARQAATEGMVLLENRAQTLPVRQQSRVAVFGSYSYEMSIGGTGSGDVHEAYRVSLQEGLKNAGLQLDADLCAGYAHHLQAYHETLEPLDGLQAFLAQPPLPEMAFSAAQLLDYADANDLAIVTLGRSAGEFADRSPADFMLRDEERAMLASIHAAFAGKSKPVVVILNIGGPIEMASWRDQADAILLAWQPGQEAGNAVADILVGNCNPSGKLTASFAPSLNDYPQHAGFPGVVNDPEAPPEGFMRGVPATVQYVDGMRVGYRYFTDRNSVSYPFGWGLSYTEFDYSDLQVNNTLPEGKLDVSVVVTNRGSCAGREIVQLYHRADPDGGSAVSLLRAFHKTQMLSPDQSETVRFSIAARDLARFDSGAGGWLLQEGKHTLRVARHCEDQGLSTVIIVNESRSWAP